MSFAKRSPLLESGVSARKLRPYVSRNLEIPIINPKADALFFHLDEAMSILHDVVLKRKEFILVYMVLR